MLRFLTQALTLAVAVGGLLLCAQRVVEAYDDATGARHAPVCESDSQTDCVAETTGTVIDKDTREYCSTDVNDHQSCTTRFSLRLRYADHSAWRDVGWDAYDDARRGDRAELRTWHGDVVRLTVRGHTATYDPSSTNSMDVWLIAAWLLLGLAIRVLRSGRPAHPLASPFLWLWLALPVSWLVHGALLGASTGKWITAGAAAAFGILFVGGLWPRVRRRMKTRGPRGLRPRRERPTPE